MFIKNVMQIMLAYLQEDKVKTSHSKTRKCPLQRNRVDRHNHLAQYYFVDDIVYAETFKRWFQTRKELFYAYLVT